MPTISASQALLKLKQNPPQPISTRLQRLDRILLGQHLSQNGANEARGGLPRGKITEIYGPPGVGKTTFGLSAAASALKNMGKVVWVDCGTSLVRKRLNNILSTALSAGSQEFLSTVKSSPSIEQLERNFIHYPTPSLPHLLALFLHPIPDFPPSDTALIVIDSLSTIFDIAFHTHASSKPHSKKTDAEKWASNRRFAIQADLISKLNKLATLHNMAILITLETVTRIRSGQSALLMPAISGVEWDQGIPTRLVLFRDWPPNDVVTLGRDKERWERLRYAGVIKVNGVLQGDNGQLHTVVPFSVESGGLQELEMPAEKLTGVISSSPVKARKRSFVEIADSEDEGGSEDEYGWDEEDEIAAEGLIVDESLLRAEKSGKG